MSVINATVESFDNLTSEGVVLVDFWAPWCGPCKMLSPVLDELATDLDGKAKVVKVNIDEHGELATRFGVMSIPTMLLFKNGEVADQKVGFLPKEALLGFVESQM